MMNQIVQGYIFALISGNFTEAMENERNQQQLQTERSIRRKAKLIVKGNYYEYMHDIPVFLLICN